MKKLCFWLYSGVTGKKSKEVKEVKDDKHKLILPINEEGRCPPSSQIPAYASLDECSNGMSKGSKCAYSCEIGFQFACFTENKPRLKCKCQVKDNKKICWWKGKSSCCSPIERLCPEADVEVDLNTGKLWGSTPTIYQAYPGSFWRPGGNACSLSSVLILDMTEHTTAMLDLFYLSSAPRGYTLDIADAATSNGDGGDGGLTPFHTEFQVKDSNIELYMNSNEGYTQLEIDDSHPLLLENLTNIIKEYTKLSVVIENNFVSWDDNRETQRRSGSHRNKYMYVMDQRPLPSNYGNKVADSFLFLGLNQVPYPRETDLRGSGLCRACITVRRKCPSAQVEVDLETGQIWGWHKRIKIQSEMSEPQAIFPTHKCSRSMILNLFTMNLKTLKIDLIYGDQDPAHTHFVLSDSKWTDGFGQPVEDSPSIRNTAQLHGFNDLLIHYLAQKDNWEVGQQQGFFIPIPHTGFRSRTFFERNEHFTIEVDHMKIRYTNNKDRSGQRENPWLFTFNKKKEEKVNSDYDLYLGLNMATIQNTNFVGAGLCRACISFDP